MNRVRQTISLALVLALTSIGLLAQPQGRRAYRVTDRQVDELIRRVETSADTFRSSAAMALDRSNYNGTQTEDEMNRIVQNFETATDQLRSRFNSRNSVAADVENLLRQAAFIDDFMMRNRLNQRVVSDWALVRTDLDALARAYGVTWRWGQTASQPATGTVYGNDRPYRVNDQQLQTLIRRIENRTDVFRVSLGRSLNRSGVNGTRTEDDINRFVRDFENATDMLRDRFNGRTSVAGDVENVLRRAAFIDNFVQRTTLNNRAENNWSLLRTDLNELAAAYSLAWNWDANAYPSNTYPTPGGYNASGRLNGTFRIDTANSDNARDVADRATRNLPAGERQRTYDRVLARLESPDALAITRTGNQVTIASSRAPQTTFDADGRERVEQMPNGMTMRVSATLRGDQLVVRSAGNRENDFTVTFDPLDGGRRLRVTREIWNERLGTGPVVVRNVYERTSETADLNLYGGGAGTYTGGNTTTSGDFAIPSGTTLITVLNNELSTGRAQENERFTLTVREPAQFEGATIEGYVSNVNRSGRVSGRSELTFNFDSIRLRDGSTYRFSGWVETVRTPTGETVRVDNEGAVRDESQTNRTVQRAAIGTAVGAIIGAIAGGGKGAAIGAVVGAGAGAGSVYVQGRDDLNLTQGTELTVRASAPAR